MQHSQALLIVLRSAPLSIFAGIAAGMWTVRYFECKYEKYNWQGLSELHTLKEKVGATLPLAPC
jgi:hypothetical protein